MEFTIERYNNHTNRKLNIVTLMGENIQ